jgi:hypothetical protein
MCDFITVFLPASAGVTALADVFDRHKIGFKQIDNPYVLGQLPAGDVCFLTTRGWCDCGTPLGSLSQTGASRPAEGEKQVRKLRKQGWSEAKIQRWREQKEQEQEKQERNHDARAAEATPGADRWVQFLTDVLRSGHTSRIGLLLHFYRRTVESERIDLLRQEPVPVQRLNAEHLLHLEEDVVYHYTL